MLDLILDQRIIYTSLRLCRFIIFWEMLGSDYTVRLWGVLDSDSYTHVVPYWHCCSLGWSMLALLAWRPQLHFAFPAEHDHLDIVADSFCAWIVYRFLTLQTIQPATVELVISLPFGVMTSRITRSRKPQPVQQHENQVWAKWTPSLTKTLVDLMVDQIQNGNKSNKTFSKKGWKFICDNFRIQTGYWWDKEQLKSRYIALRKQYISVRSLLNHCDFQWDETSGKITSTDEAWVRYIKEHPDAEAVRSTGCPMYNQLHIIFVEPEISGKHNRSPKECEETPGSVPQQHLNISAEELSQSGSDKYADLANRKRGRGGIENGIAKGILEIASATKFRAEAIKKRNEECSITDCIKALDELIGVISDQV